MIKKILFLTLSFVLALSAYSQIYTITPMDSVSVVETVTNNNDEVVLYAYVRNDSSADLTFKWRVINNTSPNSWSVSYCDNTNCLDLASFTESTFLLKADSTSILKMAYLPFLLDGTSEIDVSVSVEGVPGSGTTVKYYAGVTADAVSGISTLDSKSLAIFPNPATNFIQIKGVNNINDVQSIELYSIIGKEILKKEVSSVADLKLNIQNLEHGVYLVKMFDNARNVFYTKTFVKK